MRAPGALDARRTPVLGVKTILRTETFNVDAINQVLNYSMQEGSILQANTEIRARRRDKRPKQRTKKSSTHIHDDRSFNSLLYVYCPSDQLSNSQKRVEST